MYIIYYFILYFMRRKLPSCNYDPFARNHTGQPSHMFYTIARFSPHGETFGNPS